jgi:hypothetical protein
VAHVCRQDPFPLFRPGRGVLSRGVSLTCVGLFRTMSIATHGA